MPNDKIKCVSGVVYINNEEAKVYGKGKTKDFSEIVLGDDEYFVMGDNRNDSYDARYWENTYVTKDEIIGKAYFIYYPFSRFGSLYK